MTVYFSEENHLVMADHHLALGTGSAKSGPYFNAAGCEVLNMVAHLEEGAAANAGSTVKVELYAASDSSGTGATQIQFQDVFYTVGDNTLAEGTGKPTHVVQTSGGVPTPLDDWTTTAANADDQEQVVVPVRARSLPAGKPWVKMVLTTGGTARNGQFGAIYQGLRSTDDPTTLL